MFCCSGTTPIFALMCDCEGQDAAYAHYDPVRATLVLCRFSVMSRAALARVGRTTVQDAAAMDYAFGFPIQYRGPEPNLATRSPGLASRQRSNDRHPHPMHWVSPCLRRSSSAMRSLMPLLQFPESLAQSARSGTRLLGSLDNSSRISSSDSPTF